MRRVLNALVAGLLVSVLLAPPGGSEEPRQWFENAIERWDQILDEAEAYFAGDERTPERTEDYRVLLESVRALATSIGRQAEEDLARVEPLLAALGAPPTAEQPPEAADVAERRRRYEERITALRSQIAESDLARARIDAIEESISERARDRLWRELSSRLPSPLAPDTVARAAPEFAAALGVILRSPAEWRAGLTAEERARIPFGFLPAAVAIAMLVAWIVRRELLRRFGPDPGRPSPSYGRRLIAAVAVAVGKGLIPAAIVAGVWGYLHRPGALISGQLLATADGLLAALLFFVLAYTIPRAVLAPDQAAWRLTDLSLDSARAICSRFTALAVVVAIDIFMSVAAREMTPSPQLESAYGFVVSSLQVALLLSLAPSPLWRREPEPDEADTDDEAAAKAAKGGFWTLVRRGAAVVLVLAVLAMIPGYVAAGRFVVANVLYSGVIVVAPILLARGLLRDLVGIFTRSALARRRLGLSARGLQATKFWVRAILDPLLLVAGLVIIAPHWGVSHEDLARWTLAAIEGITIGSITISPIDIVLAVTVFFVAMALTRVMQRTLQDRVLPETQITESVGHSIVAGVGYVGVVVAVAIAIAVAGVDLTDIAIVVGALSVGIGFGLQNMVNNFVSGLILLVERPIKVGDWVVVGGLEGFVRRVNFRATEIETWQRAAVIMPNAEILSSPVTNWTHRDRYGRIEIAVGVAYGSDVQRVRQILLDCADAEPLVMAYPAPYVLFRNFGESSLDFELRCFTNDVLNRLTIGSNLRFAIDRRFREAGIEIPFPQRVVHMAPAPEAEAPDAAAPPPEPGTPP